MKDISIRVDNLSKQYRIGGKQARYKTLRDTFSDTFMTPLKCISSAIRGQSAYTSNETIWALKDVNFEISRGEVVGIIGRNGAGKSTLLKILSRITEPTGGRAEVHGRVGSLLEVGTGFHPELTGKENVYLNGAILGMRKAEINRKFDDIVKFAEMNKFIDTPIKHYSSGMQMRLAFAVAAHLETEALMVDEVLAVGDFAFQKKCLGKMDEIGKSGRTVLFVSHNLTAIRELCSRCILLNTGKVEFDGSVKSGIETYIRSGKELYNEISIIADMHQTQRGLDKFQYTHAELRNNKGKLASQFLFGSPFELIIQINAGMDIKDIIIGFSLFREEGERLFMSFQNDSGLPLSVHKGSNHFKCHFDPNILLPGRYWIDLGAQGTCVSLNVPQVLRFDILSPSDHSRSHIEHFRDGLIRPPIVWEASQK